MQIFVLGMHRSGTSAVARLLAAMGAHVGDPEETLGASDENPVGFWERRDVVALDKWALQEIGCAWDRIGRFVEIDEADGSLGCAERKGAFPDSLRSEFTRRARAILEQLDAASTSGMCVLKDPRMCLTLPLWLEAASRPVAIFVHRNPWEVARSLAQRNGFRLSFGLALWEAYCTYGLRTLRDVEGGHAFCSYQGLLDDPLGTAEQLRSDLGWSAPIPTAELEAAVEAGLQRNRARGIDPGDYLNERQLELHHALMSTPETLLAAPPLLSNGARQALLDEERSRIDPNVVSHDDYERALRDGLGTPYQRLEQRHAALTDAYDRAKQHIAKLEAAYATAKQQRAAATAAYERAKQQRDAPLP